MADRRTTRAKELSSGVFGAEVKFHCLDIRKERFSGRMHEFIMEVAKRIDARPNALLGHAKMFVGTNEGFLKLSVVDPRLGVDFINELRGDSISEGWFKIMAVAVGVKDSIIEEIVEDEISRLWPIVQCDILGHEREH